MDTLTHQDLETRRRDFLEALYRRYSGALLKFLGRQRVQPEDAREIVQETYCRLQQVAGVESLEFPRAYLFRTALNLAQDGWRQQRRAPLADRPAEAPEPASEEPTAYRVLKGQQEVQIIRQALTERKRRPRQHPPKRLLAKNALRRFRPARASQDHLRASPTTRSRPSTTARSRPTIGRK